MKYVMFANESGDEAYPVCISDVDAAMSEIVEACKHLIGDDYDGEFCWGTFFVEDYKEGMPKLSDLIKYRRSE